MVIQKLAKREGFIDGLVENPKENLELIGLYTAVLKLLEKEKSRRPRNFCRGFSLYL